jgi:hypothetical protein
MVSGSQALPSDVSEPNMSLYWRRQLRSRGKLDRAARNHAPRLSTVMRGLVAAIPGAERMDLGSIEPPDSTAQFLGTRPVRSV